MRETPRAMGTRAIPDNYFELSQTATIVSVTLWRRGQSFFYFPFGKPVLGAQMPSSMTNHLTA